MKYQPELFLFALTVGLAALSLLPAILAFLWERRLVWPYVPMELTAEPGPTSAASDENPYSVGRSLAAPGGLTPSRYTAGMVGAAPCEGLDPVGTFADGTSRLYHVRYDFWRAEDGVILVLIGSGRLAAFPVQGTWLYTRLADGRLLVTCSRGVGSEFDLTGCQLEVMLGGDDLGRLLEYHRGRLNALGVSPLRYAAADPLGEHRAVRAGRIERLVALGYATYLDPARTAWRYTLRGALVVALRSYCRGMRRVFWPDSWLGATRPTRER